MLRKGYIYIRAGEACSVFKFMAVTKSLRAVQEFTFLREKEPSVVEPAMLLHDMGRATLPRTAILTMEHPTPE
jgi:hypothetical protein